MKITYVMVITVLIIMFFLVGCNVGQSVKSPKTISKINVTNQTMVKANVTSNITKINATLNASKVNATNVSIPRLNITSFNVTQNYTNISASGNISNVSMNVTNNKTNSTK